MRRSPPIAAVLAACLASCEGPPPPPPEPAASAARLRRAVLRDVEGTVRVKRGGEGDWIDVPASRELELGSDDKVHTLPGARARLVFDGGSSVTLDERSLVSVSGAGPLQLWEGRVDADVVLGGYQLEVRAAGASVRAARREIRFQ